MKNIINSLPQRMVHQRGKEYTCLLKGRKKCTFLFFVRFQKLDQVARSGLGMAVSTLGRGCQAAGGSSRVVWVLGTADQSHCHSGFGPMEMSPPLFQGVLPTIPVPVSQGLASPRGLQDTGRAPGRPGPGRQALSYGRWQLEAGVTAALISSPSGS